jgi:RimJ/RimL family protein N-acetyltransferase
MEIETKRLLLRPLRDDDASAMAAGLNNLNVSRNLTPVAWPHSVAMAQWFINKQRSLNARSMSRAIAFRVAPDEMIGHITYESHEEGEVSFGYWLKECCWRMGLMTEAATAIINHAMTQTDIAVIHSGYHTNNPNSGRILRKLGFLETHAEMKFSVAQQKEVPVMQMKLIINRHSREGGNPTLHGLNCV